MQVHHCSAKVPDPTVKCTTIGLVTQRKVVIPPSSEMEVMVKQMSPTTGTWIVENDVSCRTGVMVARGLVCTNSSSLVPVRLLNPVNDPVILRKRIKVANMGELDEDCTLQNVSAVIGQAPLSKEDRETLWKVVCKVGDHLNDEEKEHLFNLLLEYADVKSDQIGRTSILKHHIDTGNAPPVHVSPRRIPQSRREEMAKLVKEMLEQGVIQQSDSPWSSPVVHKEKRWVSQILCRLQKS